MRESVISLFTAYVPMFGVPAMLYIYMLSFIPGLSFLRAFSLSLAMLGLLGFGIFGMRHIFLVKKRPAMPLFEEAETIRHGKDFKTPKNSKAVKFRIKRFNPQSKSLEEHEYSLPADRFDSVLDGLLWIKHTQDPTLSLRYSCRMGVCGSCGMVVNGKPVLACETNIWKNTEDNGLDVEPMRGHPMLRDLVTDFDDFFEKHLLVNPYLYRKAVAEKYSAEKEYKQTRDQLDRFLPFSYCIMCGLCLDACPVVNTNPTFIGPQALSQAYRYYADSRDQAGVSRI